MPNADLAPDGAESAITIDLDGGAILSATDTDVMLLGDYFASEEDDPTSCVVTVSRKTLHDMLDTWLDKKADFLASIGAMAGVGAICLGGLTPLGTIKVPSHLLPPEPRAAEDEDEDHHSQPVDVPAFTAGSFFIDMASG